MQFVTVRNLRNKPAQIRQALLAEKDMVLTSNGKPFAIITAISEGVLEKSLAMMRRIRAENAVVSMQKHSAKIGTNKLSLKDVNVEITAARRNRK